MCLDEHSNDFSYGNRRWNACKHRHGDNRYGINHGEEKATCKTGAPGPRKEGGAKFDIPYTDTDGDTYYSHPRTYVTRGSNRVLAPSRLWVWTEKGLFISVPRLWALGCIRDVAE